MISFIVSVLILPANKCSLQSVAYWFEIRLHFVALQEAEISSKWRNTLDENSRATRRPEFNHKDAIKSPIKAEGRECK